MPRRDQTNGALFQYLMDVVEMTAREGEYGVHTKIDQGTGSSFAAIGTLQHG